VLTVGPNGKFTYVLAASTPFGNRPVKVEEPPPRRLAPLNPALLALAKELNQKRKRLLNQGFSKNNVNKYLVYNPEVQKQIANTYKPPNRLQSKINKLAKEVAGLGLGSPSLRIRLATIGVPSNNSVTRPAGVRIGFGSPPRKSRSRSRSRSRSPKGCLPGKKCTRVAPTSDAPAPKPTFANTVRRLLLGSRKVAPNKRTFYQV